MRMRKFKSGGRARVLAHEVQQFGVLSHAYVPGIHVLRLGTLKTWMAGTSPAMTSHYTRSCQELFGDKRAELVVLGDELGNELM
jgi:hypothetical protein